MISFISVCDISWWMVALAMIVPAVLAWLLANVFAKEKNEAQRMKIKQLQAELKKCYEEKQIIKTKLVSPAIKFTDMDPDSGVAQSQKGAKVKKKHIKGPIANPKSSSSQTKSNAVSNRTSKYPKLQDNLEIIEGVGPKMKELLHDNGITTWQILSEKSPQEIKEVLNKYGDRYRIIDPKTWPLQAELAHQGLWEKLITTQESDGGKDELKSSSKVSKLLIKYGYLKKWKQDDLKAIEGVGPKIAGLLKEGGINTWNQLANTKVEEIKAILEKAGKRYALATPDSWPIQAKLAAEGNFSGLEQLQSKLKRGK